MNITTEAEKALIACLFYNENCRYEVLAAIKREDFYDEVLSHIFSTMEDIIVEGYPIDRVAIQHKLKFDHAIEIFLDVIDDKERQLSCKDYATYVQIILNESKQRQLLDLAHTVISDITVENPESPDAILNKVEDRILNITEHKIHSDFVTIPKLIPSFLKTLKEYEEQKHLGLTTGITSLDNLIGGFRPGGLYIIAGRPGMGKTALANHIIASNLKNCSIALFTYEMSAQENMERIVSNLTGINSWKIRTGKLNRNEWEIINTTAETLKTSKLFIDETGESSIKDIRHKIKKLKFKENIGLVIIDYIQLMPTNEGRSREQEVASLSKGLKLLARQIPVPVVALSQLSRKCEERDNKRPLLSDLRESGAIEQDADVVAFPYRDYYYTKEESTKDICEIDIAKQRNGPVDRIYINYDPARSLFQELKSKRKVSNVSD